MLALQGFSQAVTTCLKKYVTFSGRAARPEYWWFMLASLLAGLVATGLDIILGTGNSDGGILNALVSLGLFLPSLAVTWRRLHDTGRPGWYVLAVAAVIVAVSATALLWVDDTGMPIFWLGAMLLANLGGVALVLWWLVSRSQPEANMFGDVP